MSSENLNQIQVDQLVRVIEDNNRRLDTYQENTSRQFEAVNNTLNEVKNVIVEVKVFENALLNESTRNTEREAFFKSELKDIKNDIDDIKEEQKETAIQTELNTDTRKKINIIIMSFILGVGGIVGAILFKEQKTDPALIKLLESQSKASELILKKLDQHE